jgi:hypothetical protein
MWPFITETVRAETRQAPDTLQRERERYKELPAEIAAATKELEAARREESSYTWTHRNHVKTFNLQVQCQVNAMKEDLGNVEIQKRARRTARARQTFRELVEEYARVKRALGFASY